MNFNYFDSDFEVNLKKKSSKTSRRTHQKKNIFEKKELLFNRKKLSKLITRKRNQRGMNKTSDYLVM